MSSEIYWIVVTGRPNSGQTTFVRAAAERTAYRDRRNMSVIPKEEYLAARNAMRIWSARYLASGDEGAPREREQIDRYQNSLLVGELTVDRGIYVLLYESSPSTRFDASWEALEQGLLGVVVMVDSAAPETFKDAARIVDMMAERDIPFVIAANKQDLPGAISTDDVRLLLNAQEVPVVPCVATDRRTIKGVLLTLLKRLQESPSA